MDLSSLYTSIDHDKGAEACFQKLEERKNKSIPSIVIKNLVVMILKSNAFGFGNEYCRQITGTAMGIPMAPNYANLFMDNFERAYCTIILKKLDYHLWYGFVLLTIFSSYGSVTSTCWIISFSSHRITVNRRT